jgi:hypothetical protein
MPLSTPHPLYTEFKPDWEDMRTTYKGQRAVKAETVRYLPATPAQKLDGMNPGQDGHNDYTSYQCRAVFYEYVKEGVQALIGFMYNKPPTIKLPASMETMRDSATNTGESLVDLLRRINVEQLITGRLGLLADMAATPDRTNPMPFIATYTAESILNWDANEFGAGKQVLNLVVLDESSYKRSEFEWNWTKQHRVLQLGDFTANETTVANTYTQGVFTQDEYDQSSMLPPMWRGKTLDQIPFVFINAGDLVTEPDSPPLIGLAILALAIYRADADYRQSLFMQGQDTLVTIGLRAGGTGVEGDGEEPLRTGVGARIDVDVNGDAKYIGVESSGLSEQRSALQADHERAGAKAGQFATKSGNDRESGESLSTRISAQTATLKQIAITGAAGLQMLLRTVATWVGANPEEVVVEANLEFADVELSGEELLKIMTARSMGAPISLESIHALMVDKGLTKLDYETEQEQVNDEIAQGLGVPPLPEDPNADDPDKKDPAAKDKKDPLNANG